MYWMHPGMGGWGAMFMVLNGLVLAVLVAGAVFLLARGWPATGPRDDDRAARILAERYARGEIDDEEYQRRLAGLALR
jgi:putative membrane protein